MHRIIIIFLSLLILYSCNGINRQEERISQVEEKYGADSYEAAFTCMAYLMNDPDDFEFAFQLIDKLISTHHFIEARYALDKLGEKNQDYRIYYLKAVCYRNEFQFEEAIQSVMVALDLSDARIVEEENQNISQDKKIWTEILKLDDSIRNSGAESSLLLSRAEKLVGMNYREAAFYDLDRLPKGELYIDESYKLKIRAELQRGEFGVADSIAQDWDREATLTSEAESGRILKLLNQLVTTERSIISGNNISGNYITMGKILVQLKSYAQAEKWIKRGIQRYPDDPRLRMALLLVYLETGDILQARSLADELEKQGIAIPSEIEAALAK